MTSYMRPGVYVRETDFPRYELPRRIRRIKKLKNLFGFDQTCFIVTATQSTLCKNKPILINNSDDFEKIFGNTTNSIK